MKSVIAYKKNKDLESLNSSKDKLSEEDEENLEHVLQSKFYLKRSPSTTRKLSPPTCRITKKGQKKEDVGFCIKNSINPNMTVTIRTDSLSNCTSNMWIES